MQSFESVRCALLQGGGIVVYSMQQALEVAPTTCGMCGMQSRPNRWTCPITTLHPLPPILQHTITEHSLLLLHLHLLSTNRYLQYFWRQFISYYFVYITSDFIERALPASDLIGTHRVHSSLCNPSTITLIRSLENNTFLCVLYNLPHTFQVHVEMRMLLLYGNNCSLNAAD